MFYKSIGKKIFLIILISMFLFIAITVSLEIAVLPKFVKYNNGIKIERIETEIKEEVKDIDNYDDFVDYLFKLSYNQNVYITLYDLEAHEISWQYLTSDSIVRIKDEYVNQVSERTFQIVTDFGLYTVNVLSYTEFVNYIGDAIVNMLPYIYMLGTIFVIAMYFLLAKNITAPITTINKKLNKFTKEKADYEIGKVDRLDEIGQIDNTIYEITKMYNEMDRTFKGDQTLKDEKEQLMRQNLSIISHELKTPLTVLKLQTECMIANIGDYKDRDKYLDENLKNIAKLEELVYSILESTEVDKQEIKLSKDGVSITKVIEDVIQDLDLLREQKELKFEFELKEVKKNIDIDIFKRAIKNIIENAIKYSPDKETVKIILDEDILEIINVNDEITNSDLKGVFNPFVRVDKSRNSLRGGHGMGLYIVAKSLEKHDFNYSIEKIRNKVYFKIEF